MIMVAEKGFAQHKYIELARGCNLGAHMPSVFSFCSFHMCANVIMRSHPPGNVTHPLYDERVYVWLYKRVWLTG